ncbi:uncharacterized protein LOC102485184, partial [Tupaia chinensis]|uniref:uncharacterized protein LOC102485184 n=1 Tax=Tupaia chinensis TaxID=246437 RepID=UPI0003C90491
SCENKVKRTDNRKWTSRTLKVLGTSEKATSPPGGPLHLAEDSRCCEAESEEKSSCENKVKRSGNRKWTSRILKVLGTSEKATSPPGGPLQLVEDSRCCETELEEKSWNSSSWENEGKRNENWKRSSKAPTVLGMSEKAKSPHGRPLQLPEVKRFCETDSEEKCTYENKCKKNEYKKRTSKTSMDLGTTEKAKSPPGGPLQLTEVKRFCETDSEEESSSRKSNIDDSWPTSDDDFIGLDTK